MNDDSEVLKQLLAQQKEAKRQKANSPVIDNHDNDKKTLVFIISALAVSIIGAFAITALIHHLKTAISPSSEEVVVNDSVKNTDYEFLKMENSGQNLVYSPLSIKNGLALLYAGASGNTKVQLENVLGDVTILGKSSNITDRFSLANAVFIRNDFKKSVFNSYVKKIEETYDAEIIYDDFKNSSIINEWVNQKTFGLINNLNMNVSSDTRMALVNALAIRLDWIHQFDSNKTTGASFKTRDNEEIIATTITQTTHAKDIKYSVDDNTTLLVLPLEPAGDAELEFIAIMPSNNLSDYVSTIDQSTILSKIASATPASTPEGGLEIHIPKFKFDYELRFMEDLMSLGITDAFSSEVANFSNLASAPLYASDAIHKANIDFSEDGIKAAAVTAFGMSATAMPKPDTSAPVVIRIDRPFFFLIRDKNNNTVWFTGTVYRPNLWSDDEATYKTEIH